jgi:hypothetical protein
MAGVVPDRRGADNSQTIVAKNICRIAQIPASQGIEPCDNAVSKKYRSAFFPARRLLRPPLDELMPDSAVKNVSPPVKSARPSRRTGDASANSSTDIDKKLDRAARSAQRLAQRSSAPAGDTTLDLFAEETQRATFQAMNTDIRQGTLAGFELPEVFMAAVQSTAINSEAGSKKRAGRALTDSAAATP